MNRFLLTVIALLLLLAVLSLSFAFAIETEVWITVAEITCLIMMLMNGTFKKSALFKLFTASIFVLLFGVLFKILHLTGADQLMALPYFTIPMVYMLYFIRKKPKDHLSVMKLLAVLFFFIPVPLSDFVLVSDDVANALFLAGHIIFWIAFVDFLVVGFREKTLFSK